MKKLVIIMATFIMSMAMLVGCTGGTEDAEAAGSQEPVSTEAESEVNSEEASDVVSEDISEEVSEEVSEEASEEAEEAVDYSAEAVMALVDDLIAKYPNENPEYIKSVVIGANIDYITEDDLNTILTAYGYTLEDLNVLFGEYIGDLRSCFTLTFGYHQGGDEPEVLFDDRMPLYEVTLNNHDMEYMKLGYSRYNEKYEYIDAEREKFDNFYYDSVDKGLYSSGMMACDSLWVDSTVSPYTNYISSN